MPDCRYGCRVEYDGPANKKTGEQEPMSLAQRRGIEKRVSQLGGSVTLTVDWTDMSKAAAAIMIWSLDKDIEQREAGQQAKHYTTP